MPPCRPHHHVLHRLCLQPCGAAGAPGAAGVQVGRRGRRARVGENLGGRAGHGVSTLVWAWAWVGGCGCSVLAGGAQLGGSTRRQGPRATPPSPPNAHRAACWTPCCPLSPHAFPTLPCLSPHTYPTSRPPLPHPPGSCKSYPEVLHSRYVQRTGEVCGEIFLFEFGAAVLWDLSPQQERSILQVWRNLGGWESARVCVGWAMLVRVEWASGRPGQPFAASHSMARLFLHCTPIPPPHPTQHTHPLTPTPTHACFPRAGHTQTL